jgi:hypothetical protein
MKAAYGYFFVLCACVLGVGSLVSIATPHEEAVLHRLVEHPDSWTLDVQTAYYAPESSEETKAILTKFLAENRSPTLQRWDHALALIAVATFFSGVGWLRERRVEQKQIAEQGGRPNAAEPPREFGRL